jgi:cobalt-zinc-cadmium efflux system membrane fusion protein
VEAELGEAVRRGQTLATIDSIELGQAKAAFLQARAREELARDNLERERSLHADRISSEQDFLTARAAHREAVAELRTAEETLHLYGLSQTQVDELTYDDPRASLYPVRAPFTGTVVERHATLGELVTPERNLFTIGDLSRVWVWIDVYERDLARVHLDDGVEVRVSAYPEQVFRGVVSYLSSRVDGETRAVRARLDVDNADGRLRPGMFARAVLSDPHAAGGDTLAAPGLAVPEAAVVREGGESVVFVALAGEHRFERRRVRTGREVGGWTEILAGLAAGEQVVVEGAFVLKSEMSKDRLGGGHHH